MRRRNDADADEGPPSSAERQALAALRESEEKFRNLVEATSDWIWETDGEGVYTYASPRVHELLGYTPAEVVGRRPFDFMPPEEASRIAAAFARLAEERRPFLGLANVNLHRDGRPVILETSGVPRFDASGTFLGFRGIDRDITDRRRAEEALREKEAFIQALLDTSRDWIWALDGNLVHTYSNPAVKAILGYDVDEIVGRSSLSLIHDEDLERVAAEVRACREQRRGWSHLVVRWRHKDGGWRFLESNAVPVLGPDDAVVGFRGVDRDITERRRAEEERFELERQLLHGQKLESLGVLAGGIAHDFNNLLMAIVGNLDMALAKVPEASPASGSIGQALQAARRATDLTREMLAYSGRGSFVTTRIGLSDLLQENAELLRAAISRKVTLNLSLAPDEASIEADPGQVQQVIMNLITNASDAIGEGAGVITLVTGVVQCDARYLSHSRLEEQAAPGRYAYVEVSDTGCGMDEATRQRLFDPFFTTKFTGRGLGMSAVLGIVRGHKGAIMVDSAPGSGSTIRVLFPAHELPAAVLPEHPGHRSLGATVLSGTVLVVDDEESVRALCLEFVEHLGLRGVGAADGEQALRLFEEMGDEVAFVLLDLTMPRMDGVATFHRMKALRPDVRVILTSGYSEQDATQRFTGEGLAGFLQKPFRIGELEDTIASLPPRAP